MKPATNILQAGTTGQVGEMHSKQTERHSTCRILMYSHDTYGLGHLTRTLRIAGAIQDRYEHTSVLILSGSPVAAYLPLPPRTDVIKMPSVSKSEAGRYESKDLEINFKQIRAMRRSMILGTAETFQPHLFLVDNVPTGMKGEILPTLEMLRETMPGTRIVLNLRDILDAPEVILETWEKDDVPSILEHSYDAIFVLGDREIHDSIDAYQLPADRTHFVGYATPGPRVGPRSSGDRPESSASSPRETPYRVLLTAGGGGDGAKFLSMALSALAPRPSQNGQPEIEFQVEVVTGPLMEPEGRIQLAREAAQCAAEIYEFVPDMPQRMAEADLVVGMAGYNTCCEILSHANAALLFPRTTPRVEQRLRAEAFSRRGIAAMLEPEGLTPEKIRAECERVLTTGMGVDADRLPGLSGQVRLAEMLAELCPEVREGAGKGGRDELSRSGDSGSSARDGGPSGGTQFDQPGMFRGFRIDWEKPDQVLNPIHFWHGVLGKSVLG